MVDSSDRFEHVVDPQCTWVVLEKLFTDKIFKVRPQNLLENEISPFYKGISKEFPYFKQKNMFFGIFSNFSQHVLAKYYRHDLYTPEACKVTMGGTLIQIWCLYLNYLCQRVDLTIFFYWTRFLE